MRSIEEYWSDIQIDEGIGVPTRDGYKLVDGKSIWIDDMGFVRNIDREVSIGHFETYGSKLSLSTVKRFFYFINDTYCSLKDNLDRFANLEHMVRKMRYG